jgi:hypothetical protein
MKSNYMRIGGAEHRQKMREICKEEIERQKRDFCPDCEEQIQARVIALLCHTLHTMYGFGRERLTNLLLGASGTDQYTVNELRTSDEIWVEWLEEKMGIKLITPKGK